MVDIGKVEKLMTLMIKHGFDVVQAESSGEKISLARNASHAHLLHTNAVYPSNNSMSQGNSNHLKQTNAEPVEETPMVASAPVKEEKIQPAGETITSPFVGTFYRSPSPDSPSFVDIGTKIKKGQALCIVEAMKLMNEIESEIEGEVVAILVENAKPVEFGTPLFIVAPLK
jgi:acetyl-CoA carboxylase biotin carboxyl carrier protein